MFAYDQLLDPTTVSHSLVSNFTTFRYDELVVVCTNILKIYHVIPCDDNSSNANEMDIITSNFETNVQLKLCHEFKLETPKITSLQRIPGSAKLFEYDKLVIGTGDKLSIVQFNDIQQTLETKSLHYYVDSFMKKDESGDTEVARIRAVDSIQSCVLFKSNSLIHLRYFQKVYNQTSTQEENKKLTQDLDEEDVYLNKSSTKKRKYQPKSLALKSTAVYSDLKNIIDFQNDGGSLLFFLYSPKGLKWAGSQEHNSVKLICLNMTSKSSGSMTDSLDSKGESEGAARTALALQTQLTSSTMINSIQDLPDDIHTIVPVVGQSGSVLLVGVNQIMLVDENFNVKIIYKLNNYCDTEYLEKKFNCKKVYSIYNESNQDSDQVELQKNVSTTWLKSQNGEDHCVVIIDYLQVQLIYEGKTCTEMKIVNYLKEDLSHSWGNITSITNCEISNEHLIKNNEMESNQKLEKEYFDRLFVSFAKGDSVFVNFKTIVKEKKKEHSTIGDHQETLNKGDAQDDEVDDIYMTEETNKLEYTITTDIQDHVLPNFGPISSMSVAPTISSSNMIKGLKNPNSNEYSMITCGASTNTILHEIQPSVQPIVEKGFKFVDVTRIWNIDNTYLVTTDSKKLRSDIFLINKNFKTFKPQGFQGRGCTTVDIQISVSRENIIHVTNKGIYIFGYNFEEKSRLLFQGTRAEVVHVSIKDDFILTTNVKGEIGIYELFEEDLYEIPLPTGLNELILTSGNIMKTQLITSSNGSPLIFSFVTADNHLIFFHKDHDDKIFEFEGLCDLTQELRIVPYEIPEEIIPDPFIKQVMIAPIGMDMHLTVLTFEGEVYMYKQRSMSLTTQFDKLNDGCILTGGSKEIEQNMYYLENFEGRKVILISGVQPFIIINEVNNETRCYKFGNLPLMSLSVWFNEQNENTKLMSVDNMKNARIMRLDIDNVYYGAKLPIKRHMIDIIDKQDLSKVVFNNVTLHKSSGNLAVSFFQETEYVAKNLLGEPLVTNPHALSGPASLSKTYTGGVLLLKYDITKRSYKLLDRYETGADCMINCLESMNLQVLHVDNRITISSSSITNPASNSANANTGNTGSGVNSGTGGVSNTINVTTPITHQTQHEYLVLGETFLKDEDCQGSSRLLVIDITNGSKFHVLYKDEFIRGGLITSLAQSKGRIVYNESNKIWVRKVMMKTSHKVQKSSSKHTNGNGIKRTMLLEPVAFVDIPSLPTKISEFNSLILTSSFNNGVYLNGFESEPYRFISFARGNIGTGSLNNEIMVNQGDCYQLNFNTENELIISKFANDNPMSINGTKLIEWSGFKMGSMTSVMHTVPLSTSGTTTNSTVSKIQNMNFPFMSSQSDTEYMTLCCGLDGQVYNVIPLKETSYRRLNIVQQQIIEKTVQLCGMNYRLEKLIKSVPISSSAEILNSSNGGSGSRGKARRSKPVHNANSIIDLPLLRANFLNVSIVKRNKLTTLRIGAHATKEIWKDIMFCEGTTNIFQSS